MRFAGIPRLRGGEFAPVMALIRKTVTLDNQAATLARPVPHLIRSCVRKPDGARVRWGG